MGMSKRKIRNRRVIKQLCTNFLKYNQVITVDLNNVSNAQIQKARKTLHSSERPGDLVVGKNTIILKALKWLTTEPEQGTKEFEDHSKWARKPELKNFIKEVQGNVALIFSDEDYSTVKDKIEKEVLKVSAKIGVVSPCDVIIPAGPTNIDVGKVQIFQKLNVGTKAVKNMLEIQKDIHIIKKGEKVTPNGAELCRLMDIKPFAYKLEMKRIWLNGAILKEDMININPDDILTAFSSHVKTLAALSLGAGLPNALSVPHMIANGFKDILAIGIAADIKFKQLTQAQSAQSSAPAPAPAKGGAPAKADAKPAEPEPPKEEENVSMGGLFD
jgi:large subunit ribosomal protein LP0